MCQCGVGCATWTSTRASTWRSPVKRAIGPGGWSIVNRWPPTPIQTSACASRARTTWSWMATACASPLPSAISTSRCWPLLAPHPPAKPQPRQLASPKPPTPDLEPSRYRPPSLPLGPLAPLLSIPPFPRTTPPPSYTAPFWGEMPRNMAPRWRWTGRAPSWSRAGRRPQTFPPPPGLSTPATTETAMSLSSSWRPGAPEGSSTVPLWEEVSVMSAPRWRWTGRATSWSRATRVPQTFPLPPGLTTPATTETAMSLSSSWWPTAIRSSTVPLWEEVALTAETRWRSMGRATSWSRALPCRQTFPLPPGLTTPATTETAMSLSSSWWPTAPAVSSTVPLWEEVARTKAKRWRWTGRATSWSRATRIPQTFPLPPGLSTPATTETAMSLSSSWRPAAPAASSTVPSSGEMALTWVARWRWTGRATSWSPALRTLQTFPPPLQPTTPASTGESAMSLPSSWRPAAIPSSSAPLWGEVTRTVAARWRWMGRATSWSRATHRPQTFPPPPGLSTPASTEPKPRMSLCSIWRWGAVARPIYPSGSLMRAAAQSVAPKYTATVPWLAPRHMMEYSPFLVYKWVIN